MTTSETDYIARLRVLSEMPGMPDDWRNTMSAVLAGLDADAQAIAAWDAADDEDMPVYDFIAACAGLKQRFASRIAEINARDAQTGA